MALDPQLLERAGQLKQELIAYAEHRRLRKEMERALHEALDGERASSEAVLINALDYFALEHPLRGGGTVLERFVADRRDLSDADRALLLAWRDVVESVFEIERREGDTLVAHNLLDELTYRINSTARPEWLAGLRRGTFIQTRIVPLGDEWIVSGATVYLTEDESLTAEETAASIALTNPERIFRNPAKLEEGWRQQRRGREHFIRYFGSDLVVVPGAELEERMRAYRRDALYNLRDDRGRTDAEKIREMLGREPSDEPLIDEFLLKEDTVGVLYAEEGLYYLPDYGRVLEAFADPALAAEKLHRAAIKDYVESPDLPPVAVRRLAEEDEERLNAMLRVALKRPDFSWSGEGEALLRRHKREYYEEPPLPNALPLSDRLEKARNRLLKRFVEEFSGERRSDGAMPEEEQAVPRVGRNDPCPCGSGKKYKRCHGP